MTRGAALDVRTQLERVGSPEDAVVALVELQHPLAVSVWSMCRSMAPSPAAFGDYGGDVRMEGFVSPEAVSHLYPGAVESLRAHQQRGPAPAPPPRGQPAANDGGDAGPAAAADEDEDNEDGGGPGPGPDEVAQALPAGSAKPAHQDAADWLYKLTLGCSASTVEETPRLRPRAPDFLAVDAGLHFLTSAAGGGRQGDILVCVPVNRFVVDRELAACVRVDAVVLRTRFDPAAGGRRNVSGTTTAHPVISHYTQAAARFDSEHPRRDNNMIGGDGVANHFVDAGELSQQRQQEALHAAVILQRRLAHVPVRSVVFTSALLGNRAAGNASLPVVEVRSRNWDLPGDSAEAHARQVDTVARGFFRWRQRGLPAPDVHSLGAFTTHAMAGMFRASLVNNASAPDAARLKPRRISSDKSGQVAASYLNRVLKNINHFAGPGEGPVFEVPSLQSLQLSARVIQVVQRITWLSRSNSAVQNQLAQDLASFTRCVSG